MVVITVITVVTVITIFGAKILKMDENMGFLL